MATPEDPIEQLVTFASDFSYKYKDLRVDPDLYADDDYYGHSFRLSTARVGKLILPDAPRIPLVGLEVDQDYGLTMQRWHDTKEDDLNPERLVLHFACNFKTAQIKGTTLTGYKVVAEAGKPQSFLVKSEIEAWWRNKDQETQSEEADRAIQEARMRSWAGEYPKIDPAVIAYYTQHGFQSIAGKKFPSLSAPLKEFDLRPRLSDADKLKLKSHEVPAERVAGFIALVKSLQVVDLSGNGAFRF